MATSQPSSALEMNSMSNKAKTQDDKNAPVISGFHTVLSIASYFAQITGADEIALGVTKEQAEAIPDLLRAFQAFQQHVELLNPESGSFVISTPFASLTKAEIVALGNQMSIPLESTWSCLRGGEHHCGKCSQCRSRRDAFKKAGVKDSTTYST